MVTQALLGTIAFSLGLIAFCFGIWLTIWCCNNPKFVEVRASKMAGYFVIALAVGSLIMTSYNAVLAQFMSRTTASCSKPFMENHRMMHEGPHGG